MPESLLWPYWRVSSLPVQCRRLVHRLRPPIRSLSAFLGHNPGEIQTRSHSKCFQVDQSKCWSVWYPKIHFARVSGIQPDVPERKLMLSGHT